MLMSEAIEFVSVATIFPDSPLWGWHFTVPEEIASKFIDGTDRRVICRINEKLTINAALMPNKNFWFVMLNQKNIKTLGVQPETPIRIVMQKDQSEFGMPVPEEFREVLDQDPQAEKYFMSLTPGKKRTLLYLVGNVKNSDSRIRKSLAIADHLTVNKGQIDFKPINEAFKAYNKM